MNILFLHRGFPGHFKYIAPILALKPNNVVMFITADDKTEVKGVNKLVYKISDTLSKTGHPFFDNYQESVLHAQAAAAIATAMKEKGIKPDIIYGHSWGSTMFMKDIFPDVPLLCYFEWFENADGADVGFDGKPADVNRRVQIRASNTYRLLDLDACDAGISPTQWQKSQFPAVYQDKIKVIHDGIDIEACKPNPDAEFMGFSAKDEVITYATRGMEPYRGFPQFMKATEILLKKRPNAHFFIAGTEKIFYGDYLENETYKNIMLNKLNLDMNRVHFVGELDFNSYLSLLQISSVHIYATVPFVLSWSLLEAMSMGCCIVASNTIPVLEIMQDNYSGLLYDFYNVSQLVEKIEYALDNKEEMQKIRENARKTVVENYALKDMLPRQIEYLNSLVKKN
jgi:glycosyltransferase involved in cell wall biosynthesis